LIQTPEDLFSLHICIQKQSLTPDLWKGYAQDSEKFLDKLQEGIMERFPKTQDSERISGRTSEMPITTS
jgi:hypothetical protein